VLVLLGVAVIAPAEDARLAGAWVLNMDASDDPDKKIERAVRKGGGTIRLPPGAERRERGRYRGGPDDEALYDRVTFDQQLSIVIEGDNFLFRYADGHERRFSTTRTTRSQSASGSRAEDNVDFSFAYWDGPKLFVESRPRDNGWILETYRLVDKTGQLEVALDLNPVRFGHRLEIKLIFDRAP
jgi:hypothetical protein